MFMIAAFLLAPTGCSFLMGKAAVHVGKKVYKKVTDDKPRNNQAKNDNANDEQSKQE